MPVSGIAPGRGVDAHRPGWGAHAHRALSATSIRQVGYVPDAGLSELLGLCAADAAMRTVLLAHEQEGPALAAGAWLGGTRAALLMQSSGVGNCVAALSLIRTCRFPFLGIVTMRGEWGETNPVAAAHGPGRRPPTSRNAARSSRAWTIRRTRSRPSPPPLAWPSRARRRPRSSSASA